MLPIHSCTLTHCPPHAMWRRPELLNKYIGQSEAAVRAAFRRAAVSVLGDARSSLGDARSSLNDAKSSLGDARSSLGDARSSLGDAKSSLGDAKSSLGDAQIGRAHV